LRVSAATPTTVIHGLNSTLNRRPIGLFAHIARQRLVDDGDGHRCGASNSRGSGWPSHHLISGSALRASDSVNARPSTIGIAIVLKYPG
jgi:hypothetical protein